MTKQMSTLRRHMIEDMKIRNMSPNSQKVYTYAVANFAGQQVTRDDFGNFHAAFFLRFVRARSQVRRQNDVRMFAERMIGGQRIVAGHWRRWDYLFRERGVYSK